MANETKASVISIKQLSGISPTGQPTASYLVSFMVGDQGPYNITIPGDQFTAANVQAATNKVAAEITKLIPGA